MEPLRLRYSEDLVRRAVHVFWWRSTGWSYFGTMALVAAANPPNDARAHILARVPGER